MKLDNITVYISTDADFKERKGDFLGFVHKCPIHNTILNTEKIELSLHDRSSTPGVDEG